MTASSSVLADRRLRAGPLPALTLMLLAPLVGEVLPGATRFSSIFVFPIEVAVWGGGAVMARYLARRFSLGWGGLLLLAVALATAEELLIQQTSLAPLVIQLKHQVYARALGLNYVYLLWALVYEAVFMVLVPVALAELIYPSRKAGRWLSLPGVAAVVAAFGAGCVLAWFSWTRIAVPKVFHLPIYQPPVAAFLAGAVIILALIALALSPMGARLAQPRQPLSPPPAWALAALAAVWAMAWYALMLLAFGIAPKTPPALPMLMGLAVCGVVFLLLPRMALSERWSRWSTYGVVFGAMLGSMAVSFVGFMGPVTADLVFKAAVDVLAVAAMLWLGARLKSQH